MTIIEISTEVLKTDDKKVTLCVTIKSQVNGGQIAADTQTSTLAHSGDWEAYAKDFHDQLSNRAFALQVPAPDKDLLL